MFMRTERLFLRPVFAEDWRDIHRGIADEAIVRNLARAPWPYREDDAREFCARSEREKVARFAITLPEAKDAPVIGMIGLEQPGDGVNELGYWIGKRWQRRGFATEAVHGVLQLARALGLETVEAGHFLDNPASGGVLAKAGFVPTGEITRTSCLARGGVDVPTRRFVKVLSETQASAYPAAA